MSDDGSGAGGSGFSWGLRPGGAEQPPAAADPPPAVEPPVADPEATQLMARVDAQAERQAESGPSAGSTAEPPAELTSALDTLFGDTRFRDYEPGAGPTDGPLAGRPVAAEVGALAKSVGLSRLQKVLIGVAVGAVAILALVALFFVGTRLPALLGPSPAVAISSSPSATPSPTSADKPGGPIANGVHPWSALLGGECLAPYTGPWAERFTVVDCAAPHAAQMVFRGTFDTSTDPAFPGVDKLQAQISVLCGASGVINLAAAGAYNDAQVQGSYPVTDAEWSAGEHDYFCFVSRSSGQPLTGSVAVPRTGA